MIAITPLGKESKERIKRIEFVGADDNKLCEGKASTRRKNSRCLLAKKDESQN